MANYQNQKAIHVSRINETQKYSDVTLVSDDLHQFKGIHHEDLKSIKSD